MRISRAIAFAIAGTLVVALGTEVFARTILGWKPLLFSRPYDPIFVSGDFVGERSRSELQAGTNGPARYGYREARSHLYQWDGKATASTLTSLSDFLFDHYLSRYSSQDVDRIVCREPDALKIFVLGGSNAVGSSASMKQTSWHALLESWLRKNLQRSDVYVFNSALGGFVSIQERLAYHLAAHPRGAKFVLFLNGPNDLVGPASSGNRPGDPPQLGTRFGQFYGGLLGAWLAEHSALANGIAQMTVTKLILEHRKRLAREDAAFDAYADSATSLYVQNMSAILRDCEANGTICLVGVHPVRSLSASYVGLQQDSPSDVLPPSRVVRLYEILFEKLAASRYSENFIDLTHMMKTKDELGYYTDSVHTDDRGQMMIAEAMLGPVETAARKAKPSSLDEITVPCGPAP